MSNRSRYDDNYEDGLGMDALIGRHLKNFAERGSPPIDMRQQILLKAQDQKNRPPFLLIVGAYFRTMGRLLWLFLSLRWLEAGNNHYTSIGLERNKFEDSSMTEWFYHRTALNSFLFGSGYFTLSG